MKDGLDLGEFISGFLAEADEHLRSARNSLLVFEAASRKGETNARAVRELFRNLHTIKGLAAMVGVEPIVEISHGMESVLRSADRAGGLLSAHAVEPLLAGIRAIEQRVEALAKGAPVAPAPEALIADLAKLEAAPGAKARAQTPLSLPADIAARLTQAEREQLARPGAGNRAVRVDFSPSVELAAAGVTITTVREAVSGRGEIVRVLPISVAATATGGVAGITFALFVVTTLSDAEIAAAAHAPLEAIQALFAPETAVEKIAEEPPDDESGRRTGVVRVDVARLDEAMDCLSTLVVTRFRILRAIADLSATGADVRALKLIVDENGRQLRDARSAIVGLRMVSVAEVLERIPLLVRGLRQSTGKTVRVQVDGDARTEIDKAVGERIFPAIVHLIRNSIDHGIETADARIAAGKPAEGSLSIHYNARTTSRVEIRIEDDGRGIDREKVAARAGVRPPATDAELLSLITRPGLSTRDEATTTSGRGLGMDIVKRIVVDELGGELVLETKAGRGSIFTIRIPLTVSILDAFSFVCGGQSFVAPVSMVEEIVAVEPASLTRIPEMTAGRGSAALLRRRGESVPFYELDRVFGGVNGSASGKALIVRRAGAPFAFGVERMLGQQEVVVRPLIDALTKVPGVSGSTDLGDGKPTLVIDLLALTASLHGVAA